MKDEIKFEQTKSAYNINGKTYTSFDEIPEDQKQMFQKILADEDKNGTPDIMEGKNEGKIFNSKALNFAIKLFGFTKNIIKINDKKYNNWDEVPSEFQHLKSITNQNNENEKLENNLSNKQNNFYQNNPTLNQNNESKNKLIIALIIVISISIIYYNSEEILIFFKNYIK